MKNVIVTASFDDLRTRHVRLLEEAAQQGEVKALIWPDEWVEALTGQPPKFPASERLYLVQALRFVHSAQIAPGPPDPHAIPDIADRHPHVWVVPEEEATEQKNEILRPDGHRSPGHSRRGASPNSARAAFAHPGGQAP